MLLDDPRHGTEAGHEQHARDGEDACASCAQAKILASRRRTKRKTQGHRYTLPLGKMHARIEGWSQGGASLNDLVRHTGLEESVIHRLIHDGPTQTVYTRTYLAVAKAPDHMPLTSIGTTRRIQALMWLGYSASRIATEAGVHVETVLDGRKPREFVAIKVRTGIADAYNRLHMSLPTATTKSEGAGITRSRNYARARGWVPPLGWNDIDDGREHPTDWEYAPPNRTEQLSELIGRGAGLSEVLRELGVGREAFQRWCLRNGFNAEYSALVEGERMPTVWRNQHTKEAS